MGFSALMKMATEPEFEPMDQDGDDAGDTLQVEVANDLFKSNNENEVELDFEADDLEITEFLKTDVQSLNANKPKDGKATEKTIESIVLSGELNSPVENITISVVGPNDDNESAKEDGEISETQSHSDEDG